MCTHIHANGNILPLVHTYIATCERGRITGAPRKAHELRGIRWRREGRQRGTSSRIRGCHATYRRRCIRAHVHMYTINAWMWVYSQACTYMYKHTQSTTCKHVEIVCEQWHARTHPTIQQISHTHTPHIHTHAHTHTHTHTHSHTHTLSSMCMYLRAYVYHQYMNASLYAGIYIHV